ncbi:MAG: hypothetical protein WKG01_17070 [Kofleriaceae bacterium]
MKPTAIPLRLGVAGDLGSSIDVQRSGFRGTWSDWSVVGIVSYAFTLSPRWEIEPYVGAGAERSILDGAEGMMSRHERATLGVVRGGVFVRVRTGRYSIGGTLGVDATIGTPTYTKSPSGTKVFEVPPFALTLGFMAAADLGN